jgi:hypothetical protein
MTEHPQADVVKNECERPIDKAANILAARMVHRPSAFCRPFFGYQFHTPRFAR